MTSHLPVKYCECLSVDILEHRIFKKILPQCKLPGLNNISFGKKELPKQVRINLLIQSLWSVQMYLCIMTSVTIWWIEINIQNLSEET